MIFFNITMASPCSHTRSFWFHLRRAYEEESKKCPSRLSSWPKVKNHVSCDTNLISLDFMLQTGFVPGFPRVLYSWKQFFLQTLSWTIYKNMFPVFGKQKKKKKKERNPKIPIDFSLNFILLFLLLCLICKLKFRLCLL